MNTPYGNYIKIGGVEAHARKGYRGFSRPRGTNKRRKLIPVGACLVPLSHVNRVKELLWNPVKSAWGRARAILIERSEAASAARQAANIEAIKAAAIEAAAAKSA